MAASRPNGKSPAYEIVLIDDDDDDDLEDDDDGVISLEEEDSCISLIEDEQEGLFIDLTNEPLFDVIDLKDYNSEGEEIWVDRFCSICFEQLSFSKDSKEALQPYFSYPECRHVYCLDCLSSWIKSIMGSADRKLPLKCAVQDCSSTLAPCRRLKSAILSEDVDGGDETYGRFVQKYIVDTTDYMFCPNQSCSTLLSESIIDLEAEERLQSMPSSSKVGGAMCHKCLTKVCYKCKSRNHDPLTCEAYQKIPMADRKPEDFALFKMIGEKKWSCCPSCKIVVEKTVGCNHITCRCGAQFCYKCGSRYLTKNEQSTMKQIAGPRNVHGVPTCKCNLFEPANNAAHAHQPALPRVVIRQPIRRKPKKPKYKKRRQVPY